MERIYSTVEDFVLDPTFKMWVLSKAPKESLKWEAYLFNHPEKSDLIQEAKNLLIELEALNYYSQDIKLSPQAKAKLWNEIKKSLPDEEKAIEGSNKHLSVVNISDRSLKKKRNSNFVYFAAACLAMGMILAGLYFSLFRDIQSPQSLEMEWLTNSTPSGVKTSFKLPDGSSVFLNSGSSVKYRKGLSGNIREIFLEGEAFFDVARDTLRPFLVHSDNFTTQALGTSFNIRNFENKPEEISLVTGKVMVKSSKDSFQQFLIPGEGILELEGVFSKSEVNLDNALAWMNKTIVFESEDFEAAMNELENWFGVKISISNLPKNPPTISARYVNESLGNILYGLSYKMDFDYELRESQVRINFNPKK